MKYLEEKIEKAIFQTIKDHYIESGEYPHVLKVRFNFQENNGVDCIYRTRVVARSESELSKLSPLAYAFAVSER